MQPDHPRMPPSMGRSEVRYISWRWTCSQSDGKGNGHTVTINQRNDA
jgi:hypothetical protein